MWMFKSVAVKVLCLQLVLGQTTFGPDEETTMFDGGLEEVTTVRPMKRRDPRFLGLLGFLAGLHFVDKDLFLDVGANHYHKGLFGFFRLSVEHPYDEPFYPQAPPQFPIMPLKDPIDVNVHVDTQSQSLSQSQALNQLQNDKFMPPLVQQDPIDEEVPETTAIEILETTTLESTTAAPKKKVTTKRIFRPRSASKVKAKSKYSKRQVDDPPTTEAETTEPDTTITSGNDDGNQTTTASTIQTSTSDQATPTILNDHHPSYGYGTSRTKNVDSITFTTTDGPFVGQNRLDYLFNNFKPSKPDYIRNVYSAGDFYPRAELNFID